MLTLRNHRWAVAADIKAEVARLTGRDPRDNPRFVIRNLRQTPRFLYETVYCGRGDVEDRIKELHNGLDLDHNSCCRFWANQLRVLLTAAAYVLMQEWRLRAHGTALARAQVGTLRDALFTLGTHVVRSVRRVVLHLPQAYPHLPACPLIACRLGAAAGIVGVRIAAGQAEDALAHPIAERVPDRAGLPIVHQAPREGVEESVRTLRRFSRIAPPSELAWG